MTGPVWDGKGTDPWLPERLAAESTVTEAERRIYREYWSLFSGWLVGVRRRVLTTGLAPDPNGVWAQAPDWQRRTEGFVQGPIKETLGLAYADVWGKGYAFDARPAVTGYLTQVTNRMVRTPAEVYDVVASEVATAAGLGESIPKIADRIDTVLTATGTERWPNRAVTVARTETIGALNAGRTDAFASVAEALDGEWEQMWLATVDARTREDHAAADGQRVPTGSPFIVGGEPLMFPGDPAGSAGNVINCVVADTLVEFPGLRAVTRRWYEGDVVHLCFASGDQLTVTPNHPVLRADGRWTPAGLLREGDHCVTGAGLDRSAGAPDEDGRPAAIGEVYRAAQQLRHPERVAGAPPDFHGDGLDGEVEVVAVHRDLDINAEPASDEQVEQFGLALADEARARVGNADRGPVALQRPGRHGGGDVTVTACAVGVSREVLALAIGESGHADPVGGAAVPWLQADLGEPANDGHAADAQCLGHGEHALTPVEPGAQVVEVDRRVPVEVHGLGGGSEPHAGCCQALVDGRGRAVVGAGQGGRGFPRFVATTQVVGVDRHAFAGHVFNLDTGAGWYIANGIATRNCRCSTLLLRPGEDIDMSNRQFADELADA